ncbi:MAG: phosphoribosylamine--glycine ligase [Proteobacteria bacterium]|nr:phosphoribosylamine--glycine ligase [Pseudomonadota bacterium]
MKVLIIGAGGREHALAWKLSRSGRVGKIFIAPGNAGTAEIGENVDIAVDDIPALVKFAASAKIDLTVVGPELPLTLGIVDDFRASNLKVFGPSKLAAELEGSKAFCKDLLKKYNIPSAAYEKFTDADSAKEYLKSAKLPLVIKADGLAAGKGVIICQTYEEAVAAVEQLMEERAFGTAGETIIVEEFLEGEEVSILAISDGTTVVPLAPAQDHKAIFNGDKGPNTGGMGAYSPTPLLTPAMEADILENILEPTIQAMEDEGREYTGVLYAGLMIKDGFAKVLEFNCRFGDPETQPVLMRMENDLFELLMAATEEELDEVSLSWTNATAVCVVLAAKGYPGKYEKGSVISGLDKLRGQKDTIAFHAGTAEKDGAVVTAGGRVLGITALGTSTAEAITKAYKAVEAIEWDGVYFRTDIGAKAVQKA